MKFLNLQLTPKDIGLHVYIHDTRDSVASNGIHIITHVSDESNRNVRTKKAEDNFPSYHLNISGTWYGDSPTPVLGITKVFTKEEYPEYYL